MNPHKKIQSRCIRWGGIYSTEPEGFFHGARVKVNHKSQRSPFKKGQDARDRITV